MNYSTGLRGLFIGLIINVTGGYSCDAQETPDPISEISITNFDKPAFQSLLLGTYTDNRGGDCSGSSFELSGDGLLQYEGIAIKNAFSFHTTQLFVHLDQRGVTFTSQIQVTPEHAEPHWLIMVFEAQFPNTAGDREVVLGRQIYHGVFKSQKLLSTDDAIRRFLVTHEPFVHAVWNACGQNVIASG